MSHKRFLAALLFLAAALLATAGAASTAPATAPAFRRGAVLVRLPGAVASPGSSIQLGRGAWLVESAIPQIGLVSLRVPPGQELAAARDLAALPGVLSAEPDHVAGPAEVPNDYDPDQQWALAAIGAPAAWDLVTGSPAITIAILDSGIALTHPDLAPKLWTNPGEIPGNGIDDDGNGKRDDVHGWRFLHPGGLPEENGNVQDDLGHGTHVSGIAGAATDNKIGMAGVSWGSPLLAVKVMNDLGLAYYTDIAAGLVYAADEGARVINLSLGGGASSDALCAAVAYARQQGSLVVAAAGNSGGAVLYPAACPEALAVGASDPAGQPAGFSNRGPELDLLAPGVSIYSTWFATGPPGFNTYALNSGTSMASPHVAGVAALVWSRWPEWDSAAVARQITSTAAMPGIGCWSQASGWGVLDAAAAVAAPASAPRTSPWCYFLPMVAVQ